MNRVYPEFDRALNGVPHVRGDEPSYAAESIINWERSPRAWG